MEDGFGSIDKAKARLISVRVSVRVRSIDKAKARAPPAVRREP
jgi:hypothetical protein